MNKSLWILSSLSLLALASCAGGTPSSTSDSNLPDSGSNTSTSQGGAGESSSKGDSSNGGSSTSQDPSGSWTSTEIALMKEHLAGHVIPYMEIAGYSLVWDSEYESIDISTTTGGVTGLDTSYVSLLEAAGYEVSSGESFGTTYYTGILTIENGAALYAQCLLSDTSFYIYAWVETPLTAWPAEEITSFFADYSLTVNDVVPSFTADYYFVTDFYANYSCYTIEIHNQESVATTEAVYTSTLEAAGWAIDNSDYDTYGILATAPNETILLSYYFSNGIFTIDIYHNV